MHLVFWQNMLSHLQSAHVRALAALPGTHVQIIGLSPMPSERTSLGWTVPSFGSAEVVENPSTADIASIVESSPVGAVHLVAGWRGARHSRHLFRCLARRRARYGLLTEGADFRGLRGLYRRLVYSAAGFGRLRHFDFIIAMGEQGKSWFTSCGFNRATTFPYAYITEKPHPAQRVHAPNQPFRLVYTGQLVHRKGVDTLLRALRLVRNSSWRLSIVGDGPLRNQLSSSAASLGLANRISFLGSLPYQAALEHVSQSDLLVLPSRFDGWGAVVNEALMAGVPVVCSDRCGAKDLISDSSRGTVFQAGSARDLAVALDSRMHLGTLALSVAEENRNWARCISGESGAHYLLAILDHIYGSAPRPVRPW